MSIKNFVKPLQRGIFARFLFTTTLTIKNLKTKKMFGISDPSIWIVYLLSILCVIGSVVFGIITWNKKDDDEKQENKDNSNNKSKQ